ncbi:MAG: 1-deoxy-D-xylulose-5-phosphate reductoisomerase [Opitutaceae bacterium]|nr:1-deoxy-D-xylulose-5-phosphate reductoisomerase [Opitutaceae bacterium]
MGKRSKVVLLGATGSIGTSALKVIRQHADKLELIGIAANRNIEQLAAIAREFSVKEIGIYEETAWKDAKDRRLMPDGANIVCGEEGLCQLAALPDCDTVLVAVVGTQGLMPALATIQAGHKLAVASKEILVLAGKFIMEAAKAKQVAILPVDSEHNALFQCLEGIEPDHVAKLTLTASGGSFRDLPLDQFDNVTLKQALNHPNWDMGPKVTIDSATMANKGLEMIEAKWLFGVRPEQVDVVIHTQSIVHSMVECVDGSVIAQMSPPDMTFAIQHALLYPDRSESVSPSIDFTKALSLDFRPLETDRYPCLALARNAMAACGVAPGVFNAANEIAVDAFVQNRIKFVDIAKIVEKTLDSINNVEPISIEEVLDYDTQARAIAADIIAKSNTQA